MAQLKKVPTACAVCGSCCEVEACVEDGRLVSIEGAKCAKGVAGAQFEYNPERILYPMKRTGEKGEGKFIRISWEEAYQIIAEELLKIRKKYGARSLVTYVGYPKWIRPAYLRFANAFGTPNFCTESSTCFQAAALAWRSLYGNGICGPDLAHTNTLLVWSSNLYHSNTGMGKMYQRLKGRGARIICVDPRHTVTAHDADIHLKLTPGTDGALALSMGQVIIEEDLYDREFVETYVYGFEEYREYVQKFTPERVQEITGVPADKIREAARLYAGNGPAAVMFSASPVVHHVNGVQNYRAVFSLIALTGNYDIEGGNRTLAGPFSPANEFGKVKRYDGEEAIGEKDFPVWYDLPCQEAQCIRLADAILEGDPYPVKAVFAAGMNHRMWPKPGRLLRALKELDFYVDVDMFWSDAARAADLVLPAQTSYEREEVYAKRGGRFYFADRAVEPLGEAKNDIQIIMDVMKAMGLKDPVMEQSYEEYMAYILEPSGLTLEELKNHPEGMTGRNLYPPVTKSYEKEPFHTPSGKVEIRSLVLEKYRESHGYSGLPEYRDFREITDVDRSKFPLILNTGSRKPQFFHSRLYRMPWLTGIEGEPLVEIHPEDGKAYGVEDGDKVRLTSPAGELTGTAVWHVGGRPGVVYVYHGSPNGDANELIPADYVDPISGFPGFKSYFCRMEKVQ